VAIPQAPPKTGGRSFGSFLRGACRTRRQLFSHPFVGALIKKGIRLWVINHNSRFVMHRLIPNSLYQSGAKYTMQDGTTATWQSCAGGCVRGGVPKAHLQNHKKKHQNPGELFEVSGRVWPRKNILRGLKIGTVSGVSKTGRPTNGVSKATLRSCTGWFVRRGSPKPNLKKHTKTSPKTLPGGAF
jgi:hypothetical protein